MKVLNSGPDASSNGSHDNHDNDDNDGGIMGLVPTALSGPEPPQKRGKRR
jgi:hypothetical protein